MRNGALDGLEQVAVIQAVDQMDDDFGVGLAGKHIALGLQGGAQIFVIFDDAVVHQSHAAGLVQDAFKARTGLAGSLGARTIAELRMCVVHRWCAVRGPTCMGDAQLAFHVHGIYLFRQLGNARNASGTTQAGFIALRKDGNTA